MAENIKRAHAWGRGDLMAIAAVRYCLGRQTYIVGDCADWLIAVWTRLSESARKTIQRDVDEEFARDDEARERNAAQRRRATVKSPCCPSCGAKPCCGA